MIDAAINLFHLGIFGSASLCFGYAVHKRLLLVSKGLPDFPLAGLEARIRSVLLNVIFQFKLFKRPVRGIMHAFIFYGFLAYAIHTISQAAAGNAWYWLKQEGLDPYEFWLTDYIWLGFSPSVGTAALAFAGLLLLIALTVLLMYSVKIGKHLTWRTSPAIQWFFLLLLCIESAGLILVLIGSGTVFYEAVVQHFSLFVLLGLGFFAYRRWIHRAKGLDVSSTQSAVILILIAVLMLSTLAASAAQAYLNESARPIWVQRLTQFFLQSLGMTDVPTAFAVRNFSWWLHICTVYTFMIYIPFSKHSHLIFAPVNYFLIKKRPLGQMKMVNLEADNAVFGASDLTSLPWGSLLDSLSCIECGLCTIECPASRTDKPLDPKKIMVDIKHSMLANQKDLLHNNGSGTAPPIIGEPYITEEELWGCTSCNACVEACPVGNNQLDAIMEMRRGLVLNESRFPPELQTAFQNMENQSNPWGIGAHSRADWCKDMNVKTMAEDSNADILYWPGCAASFDERNKKAARAFVSIMQKANTSFRILGTEENCTGDSARRAGNEYLYQVLAKKNIKTFDRYKVKKIVTACPHCYNTLKNEYPQMGGHYNVQHHSDFIDDLIRNKKIRLDEKKVKEMKKRRGTYHDSCYLGRYNEIYEEPRRLTTKALGMDIAEPIDHHRKSLCCGAGGAHMWMEEKHGRVNNKRSQQLIDTGADTVATACPFCITMISDGVKNKNLSEDVQVFDVAELTAASMEGGGELPAGFTAKQQYENH